MEHNSDLNKLEGIMKRFERTRASLIPLLQEIQEE